MRRAALLSLVALVVAAVVLGGCGAGTSGNEGCAPPPGWEPKPFMAFVALISKGSDAIDKLVLAGTHLELNPQATAVAIPAGTTQPVALAAVKVGDEWIDIGPVPLQPGLNLIEVDAPDGYALTIHTVPPGWEPFPPLPPAIGVHAVPRGRESSSDAETAIQEAGVGTLRVGFEMLADGTIIAPDEVWAYFREDQTTRRLITNFLAPGDYFRAELHDPSGGVTISERQADQYGFAVIRDPVGGLSDPPLWGPDCVLALYFVRNHDLLPRH